MSTSNRAGVQARAKQAIGAALFAGVAGLALAPHQAAAQPRADQDGRGGPDRGRPCAESERRPNERREDGRCFTQERDPTTVDEIVSVGINTGPDSLKYVAPPLDTPQIVTVVPKAVIEAQNLLTLRDILSTVPGITFGAGEGGGGYGDSVNLRGYAASSDLTVDGIRDSAQYTRSDPFNLEQLEVTNGANGSVSGSGSVGGSINQVSKVPFARDVTQVSLGGGTDNYARITVDANKTITDTSAFRINAMLHRNDVPGRDVENFKRWGIAPSFALGLGGDTRATFSFFHQEDDNIPQYGVPFYNGRPVPGIPTDRYYGFANLDKQESEATAYTIRLDHDFSADLHISNVTRYSIVDQLTQVTPPQGTFCLANGTKPAGFSQSAAYNATTRQIVFTENTTGYASCTASDPAPGFARLSGPRGNTRDSHNTTFHNQTDVSAQFDIGGIENRMTAGVALTSETFFLDTGNVQRTATGATVAIPDMNIANPDNIYTGAVNYIRGSTQEGTRDAQSLYVFDAATLSPQFEINGSIRYDHSKGVNSTDSYVTTAPTAPATTPSLGDLSSAGVKNRNEDDLFSYRLGLVFKPVPNASLYVAYGNSQTPSQSAVNGACSATTCNVEPEEARNVEVGAKWDVFDGRLSLTGSVFQNGRTNYKVPSNEPGVPDQVVDGSSEVRGVTLGASGKITDQWAVFGNYTYMDSEVTQGISNFCRANPTAATCVNAVLGDTTGDPLTTVPDHAFSLFTSYDITPAIQVTAGLTYQGEYYVNQHGAYTAAALPAAGGNPALPAQTFRTTLPLVKTEAYTVARLGATWRINRETDVRVNVNNLFDEEYYQRGRNNGWATPGDARNVVVTLNRRF